MDCCVKNIAGKKCHIYIFGTGKDALVLWGTYAFTGKEDEALSQHLDELCPDSNFTLVAFYVDDWNAEFSPWEVSDSKGQFVFTGKGKDTLRWLTQECIPSAGNYVAEDAPAYLVGYSLAGLFALWALYECDLFTGVACCSGSLWMDGWKEYVEDRMTPEGCRVYLSLGGKEEKTSDVKMARVGERFREQEKLLKADPNVKASIYERNKGGHFADSGKRIAKGIAWLLAKS